MTNAVTKRQEEVLLRALKYIKEVPDRLDMRSWGTLHPTCGISKKPTFTSGRKSQPVPPCGTTACMAGTVLLITKAGRQFIKTDVLNLENLENLNKDRGVTLTFPWYTDKIAQNILKLTEKQAGDLFFFRKWKMTAIVPNGNDDPKEVRVGWPTQFSKAYNQAKNGKERYKALEARVKYFIRTGL